uniref:Uncharacterized protein n=1 Tax=Arundo donax TaxID=35708 RepID=A0A0A9FKR9_ARUDO
MVSSRGCMLKHCPLCKLVRRWLQSRLLGVVVMRRAVCEMKISGFLPSWMLAMLSRRDTKGRLNLIPSPSQHATMLALIHGPLTATSVASVSLVIDDVLTLAVENKF